MSSLILDINGNRMLKTVELVLELVEKELKPLLIVVKSEELYDKLKQIILHQVPIEITSPVNYNLDHKRLLN